jgi:hypothetical protein
VKLKTVLYQAFGWAFLTVSTAAAALPSGIEVVQDPFHPGWVFQSIYTDTETQKLTSRGATLQLGYGTLNGVVGALVLPILFTDTPESAAGASVPRTGGVGNDRIEFDGYFRFWGNAASYFGLEMGIGLPYQSDPQIRNTSVNSFFFPAALLTRVGWDNWSFRFSFSDDWTLPSVTTSKTTNTYHDQADSFGVTTYVSLFQKTRFSHYFRFSESFAYQKETGTDANSDTFLTKDNPTNEGRTIGLGVDTIPWMSEALILTPELDYKILPFQGSNSPLFATVRLRWAF